MSGILSVLAPAPITDAILTSTVPEADYAPYAAGTAYTLGARCISTTTHRIYESQQGSNTGHDPTNVANQSGTTIWWNDIGPTNKWAMFDGVVSTQTTIASPLTVVLRPGFFNSIYLAAVDAQQLDITVRDAPGGNIIYAYSAALEASAPSDYYEYFFDRFKPQTDFLAIGIDPFNNAEITLTLSSPGGLEVACGVMAVGDLRPLGDTQRGATAKPKTYSYINQDAFGNTTIVRRKATTDMAASATLDISEANSVLATIQGVLDVPCVWVCTDSPQYSGLRVFGLGSGEIKYDDPDNALLCNLSLTVQGLI